LEQIRYDALNNKYVDIYSSEILDLYANLHEGASYDLQQIGNICRLLLREDIGGIILCPRKLKIYIGYDYLMGIHSSTSIDSLIPIIEENSLFVEEF
jgi:hypothetical protein